ncbi:MAG: sugar ABC transporter permease [Clostridia bacterium]|nr:sugar ABC transporter permease [Clostridia bacterium]
MSIGAGNRKERLLRQIWLHKEVYLLFLPVFLWFAIFKYAPMYGLTIAFKDYKILLGVFDSEWVGFDNFSRMFLNPAFPAALVNTLIISALKLLFCFPIPIIFAVLLDEMRTRLFKKVVQTTSYLPHFISWAVAAGMVGTLLNRTVGPVAAIVRAFGGTPQNYMNDPEYFRLILVVSDIWKGMGWSAIIYIAAIAGVDGQLHEAATIDGANRFQRVIHVTLPGIRSIIAIQLILAVGNILNSNFDQVYMMVSATTQKVGETLDYFVYRVGINTANNFPIGTAAGLFKNIIGFVLIILTNQISHKLTDGEGIW